jgi:glycine cleavage system aminomethyltransferase T
MSHKSFEDVLNAAGNPVQLLRNSQTGPYIYPVVPPEFTNWRDEQRAWRETCILFNQSYHMTDMYVEGPDALKVLTMLGVNSFKNFGPSKAKSSSSISKRIVSISSDARRFTTGCSTTVRPATTT